VRHADAVPLARSSREAGDFCPVDSLETETAAAAAVGRVAQDQIGIDLEARTGSITQSGGAIYVGDAAAFRARRSQTVRTGRHDSNAAAVGRDRRVRTLIEQNRVLLDIAVPVEANVSNASAVARAHVPANPVVSERVPVCAGAEADT